MKKLGLFCPPGRSIRLAHFWRREIGLFGSFMARMCAQGSRHAAGPVRFKLVGVNFYRSPRTHTVPRCRVQSTLVQEGAKIDGLMKTKGCLIWLLAQRLKSHQLSGQGERENRVFFCSLNNLSLPKIGNL